MKISSAVALAELMEACSSPCYVRNRYVWNVGQIMLPYRQGISVCSVVGNIRQNISDRLIQLNNRYPLLPLSSPSSLYSRKASREQKTAAAGSLQCRRRHAEAYLRDREKTRSTVRREVQIIGPLAGDDLADGADWIGLPEPPPGYQAPPICHPGLVVKFCLPLGRRSLNRR